MIEFPTQNSLEDSKQIRLYILNNHDTLFNIRFFKVNEHIDAIEQFTFYLSTTYHAYFHSRILHECVEQVLRDYRCYIARKKIIDIIKKSPSLFHIYIQNIEKENELIRNASLYNQQ